MNGARALGRNTGRIAPGAAADLILVDFEAPNLIPCHDEAENLVFSAHGSNVVMNMARGKVIYQNGDFLTLDLERIQDEVRRYGPASPIRQGQRVTGKAEIMANSFSKKNSFFGGAAILTVGIIIVKLIGALYKIPLGNIISDEAFADFNTAYYIYSLLIIISTGGLPVALSKMVSEANALGRGNQVKKTFRLALMAFCTLGIICCLIMLIFPNQLASLMNNTHSAPSILALAPALFFICPMSALRGYFQGHSLMTPTAVSQIIEALCKLVIGLALAAVLVSQGAPDSYAAAGAIFGVSVGCALGAVYIVFCFRAHRRAIPVCDDQPLPLRRDPVHPDQAGHPHHPGLLRHRHRQPAGYQHHLWPAAGRRRLHRRSGPGCSRACMTRP